VAKTCPSCGYGPIGPFIDNCPICAEPVRNVRSNPARPANLPPWLKWVLGGLIAAVLGVAGCCGLGAWLLRTAVNDAGKAMEQARAEAEAARRARTVVVTAAQLLHEFQNDPAAADRKYKGKHLEISGVVERVGRDGDDTPFVILHAGDDRVKLRIECYFDPADEEDEARIERLGQGQTVTVRGDYGSRVSNVQVRDCVLVK
jgi:hypothetical protein